MCRLISDTKDFYFTIASLNVCYKNDVLFYCLISYNFDYYKYNDENVTSLIVINKIIIYFNK